jgi:hypothetical protein
MEEKNLNEKESIELISRMIQQSSHRIERGSGNLFLVWGYVCAAVSLLVFCLFMLTANPLFNFLYLLIPVFGFLIQAIVQKKTSQKEGHAMSFTDFAIGKTWSTLSPIFFIAMLPCIFYMFFYNQGMIWIALFVLGLLLPGIGTTISGQLLKEKVMIYGGYVGIILGVIVLCECMHTCRVNGLWYLIFSAAYVFMMIIPGHYLNLKGKRKQL